MDMGTYRAAGQPKIQLEVLRHWCQNQVGKDHILTCSCLAEFSSSRETGGELCKCQRRELVGCEEVRRLAVVKQGVVGVDYVEIA